MPISRKQKQILAFPYTHYSILIAEGAIRSGKTAFMLISFIDWAMRSFDRQTFAICGHTVDSTTKNLIAPYLGLSYARRRYKLRWKLQEKLLIVSDGVHTNTFEVFGGRDESSYKLIQGRTMAGALLDEVVLMPESFVDQATARCSVQGSKIFFNCNPEGPEHWFYKKWILRAKELNALRLHFELDDNPALSQEIIDRYKAMYEGVFYDRYIRGLWCVADGLVYGIFSRQRHVIDVLPKEAERGGSWFVSCDYGTLNPCSMGLWCIYKGIAYRVQESYYSGRETAVQRTDEEYYDMLTALIGSAPVRRVVVDPSAASFITTIRRHGAYAVRKAHNDVLPGIRLVATLLQMDRIRILSCCTDCIREFGLYRWDDKVSGDAVIKDNDHAMDDVRYFCNTIFRRDPDLRTVLRGYKGGDDDDDE